MLVPTIPAQTPANKYKEPISLWLHDQNHFFQLPEIDINNYYEHKASLRQLIF